MQIIFFFQDPNNKSFSISFDRLVELQQIKMLYGWPKMAKGNILQNKARHTTACTADLNKWLWHLNMRVPRKHSINNSQDLLHRQFLIMKI